MESYSTMIDQEIIAEFGQNSSGDGVLTGQPELGEAESIFDRIETIVEEAKSVDEKKAEEETASVLQSESDEKSDKASSTADSSVTQSSTIASAFPRNAEKKEDFYYYNDGIVAASSKAKEARVKFLQTKRGLGLIKLQDPPEVDVVKEAIRRLHLQLMNKVSPNDARYAFQIESICLAYDRLRQSCHEFTGKYEAKKRPSRKEKQWLELSKEIEEKSDQELGKFKAIKRAFILGHRTEGTTWTEILSKIRSTDNFVPMQDEALEKGRSSDSRYGVLDRDKKVYVKKEDRIADTVESAEKIGSKKVTEFGSATSQAKINPGMTVSDRNVSSTRLADSLGIGDILARSETVFLDERKNRAIIGVNRVNAMEAHKGENIMTMLDLCKMVKMPGKLQGKTVTFSAKAAKQMFDLQILDVIAGQIDRHFDNVLADFEIDGNNIIIKAIIGIDNDMAFGVLDGTKESGKLSPISNTRTEADGSVKRQTAIPYISRELYDNLMKPGMELMLKYDQLDLRSDAEIKALLDRFTYVRNEIRDLHQRGLIQIIDDEEEFKNMYIEKIRTMQDSDDLIPSYMSRYVKDNLHYSQLGNFFKDWIYER